MRTSWLKWAAPAGLVGALVLWMSGYFAAERSDGFAFARYAIRRSPVIRASIGGVESVRLSPWGFVLQYVGNQVDATFECEVKGRLREGTVAIRVHGVGDDWQVRTARLDGRPIELDSARAAASESGDRPHYAAPDSAR